MLASSRTKPLALTALALATALGLSACSSAPTATESAPTAQEGNAQSPASSGLLTAEDFAERISAAQLAAGTADFDTEIAVQGQTISAHGQMALSDNADEVRVAMVMEMPGAGSIEMRIVGDLVYLGMGELTDGKFIEIDPAVAGAGEDFGSLADQFTSQQTSFDAYAEALSDFSVSDQTETLDGVETHVYTLVLDTTKMAELEGVDLGDFEDAGFGDTLEYRLYVGDDDLPRRMVTQTPAGDMVMNFSNWGAASTVEAPGADEIIDGSMFGM